MIYKILNDKKIKEAMKRFVTDIKREFKLTKAPEIEVNLNEFYYSKLHEIVEAHGLDAEVYPTEFKVVVDHLILKAKDEIYNLKDIAIEKVEDEDDIYIITRISPFRHEDREFESCFSLDYINPIKQKEVEYDMDYQVELAKAYEEEFDRLSFEVV